MLGAGIEIGLGLRYLSLALRAAVWLIVIIYTSAVWLSVAYKIRYFQIFEIPFDYGHV